VTVVNCGHHPPLMVGDDAVEVLASGEGEPPLGLAPTPKAVRVAVPPRARLLVYTDGLVEARDRQGSFFPLAEHVGLLRKGTLDAALDRFTAVLTAYCGHEVDDDLVLVLTEPLRDPAAR